MTNSLVSLALYATLWSVVVFGLWYDINHANFKNESVWEYQGFGGKFKFLTFITMVRLWLFSFSNRF